MAIDPAAARAEPGVPVPPNGLLSDKACGEVTAADRDFVTKVRLAGLWEIPAGEMAQERSQDARIHIDRLRAAHGKIFPAIAAIRAGTRNDTVRRLAQQANQFVMTHMTLLESSGIVDFRGLPTVPPPAASAAPVLAAERRSASPATGTPVVLLALAGGIAAGILGSRFLVGRRPRRHYRG